MPSPRRLLHGRGLLVLVSALVIAGAAVYLSAARHVPPRYTTAAVMRGNVARVVSASGTINPVTTVQVGSYVSGIVQQVLCDYNTPVKKGQLCAKLDPRPFQATVDQDAAQLSTASAQLAKDQTNLNFAKTNFDRISELQARGVSSQQDLDAARNSYAQAKAQVDLDAATVTQRKAALDSARVNLGYVNIVSPVDGTVVSRNVNVGQTVAASFQTPTLFLIASDLTKMQVDTNVSESDIGAVGAGMAATFSVEAFPTRTFTGKVVEVRQAPQAVQNVVTYDVVVSAPNPDQSLKPGMTAMVRIVAESHSDVLTVPDQALRFVPGGVGNAKGADRETPARQSGKSGVWVLHDDRPARVPVTIGLNNGTVAEVTSGSLQPGDRVIVGEQTEQTASSDRTRPPRMRF